jgi:hypothetical protein
MNKKPTFAYALLKFVFPITFTATLLTPLIVHNSIQYTDRILLEFYLASEKPLNFTSKNYLEELHNTFINNGNNVKTQTTLANDSNFFSGIKNLRGGKNYQNYQNNLKKLNPTILTHGEVKFLAIPLMYSGAGLTTVNFLDSLSKLKRLSLSDIAIIKNCIDSYLESNKINFIQLIFTKQIW